VSTQTDLRQAVGHQGQIVLLKDVPEAGQVTVALSVTLADGVTVLGKAFAVVSPA
jgi:hypothetical protein